MYVGESTPNGRNDDTRKRSICEIAMLLTCAMLSNSSCLLSKASAFTSDFPTPVCFTRNVSPCSSIHLITWNANHKKKKQLRIRLSNSIANEIDNEQTMPCLQVSKGFDTAKLARAPLILQIVCTLRRPYWTSTKKWQPSCSTKYSFGTWTQFSCKSFAYQVSKKPFHLTYVSRVTIWPQFLRDFTIYYISQAASANAQIKRITSKNKQREREQTEREREREVFLAKWPCQFGHKQLS